MNGFIKSTRFFFVVVVIGYTLFFTKTGKNGEKVLMGITTCKWIVHIMLHDTSPRNERTGVYFLALYP